MCKVVYMKTSGHTSVVDYCLLFTVDVSTQGISYPRSVHPDRIFIGSRVCHRLEFWDVFQASRDTKRNTPTRKTSEIISRTFDVGEKVRGFPNGQTPTFPLRHNICNRVLFTDLKI